MLYLYHPKLGLGRQKNAVSKVSKLWKRLFLLPKIKEGGTRYDNTNQERQGAHEDCLLVAGRRGIGHAGFPAPCDGGHHLGSVFNDHEGCVRPAGGAQHHCGGDGGSHCADRQDDFQEPARGG